jgi:periplasmic protein TonB
MNFSQRQADPRRHLVGMTVVILFHAFVVYALVTGLAKKVSMWFAPRSRPR